jgi:hypothetical protein
VISAFQKIKEDLPNTQTPNQLTMKRIRLLKRNRDPSVNGKDPARVFKVFKNHQDFLDKVNSPQ